MSERITAWTDPRGASRPPQSIAIDWREDGRVEVQVRDQDGHEVVVVVPGFIWERMAQEISWNMPRRQASLAAARLGMTPASGPA